MIDPSIALNVRPPQFADPLEQAGKAMNLLAMRQQIQAAPLHQQLLQQQVDTGAMENQQRQLDMQDQQKMRTVWTASGGDPDKMFQMALRAGIGPKPLMALKESLMKQATEKATLNEKELANHAAKNDQLNSLMQPVLTEADPQKQAALWDQQQQEGLRQGILTPEEVQAHPYPGSPDGVKQYAAGLATDKWITSQAALLRGQAAAEGSKREAELQPFKKAEAEAKKEQVAREQYAREHPQDPAAQQAALNAKERADKAQADREFVDKQRHERVEEGQGAARVGVERGRLAVEQQNAGLDAAGNPISFTDAEGKPVNISPIAKQIAEYKLPAPAARSYSSNRGLMNQVLAVNPNFDIGAYEQRYQTLKDLRPGGKLGTQALALNTLIRHSDDLIDAVGALGNGNFTPGNAGFQKLRQMFGDSAPTNFDQLRQFVAGETVKLVRNGGGDQKDMEDAKANINRAGSPKQLLDALKVNFGVAGGKMQALNEAVRSAIGQKDYTALDQGATDILKRRGYDTETMKPAAAGGALPQVGHVVTVSGKKIKITAIHPDGTFDGNEVK